LLYIKKGLIDEREKVMFFSKIVSPRKTRRLCDQLADKVSSLGVDCVVSFDPGGWFVAEYLATRLGKSHWEMVVDHFSDDEYCRIHKELRFLPMQLRPAWIRMLRLTRRIRIIKGIEQPELVRNKKIALVGDVFSTKKSEIRDMVRRYLNCRGASGVYGVSLSCHGRVDVDACATHGRHEFPWTWQHPTYMRMYLARRGERV
jgi:hypothetical protein